MKILLSAYACEPDRGSEPGVGWNWALQIEKLGYQVWVLTRKNNQAVIEKYYKENDKPEHLNFIYFDVPQWLSWWKKGGRGVYLYYLLWQVGAYFVAKEAHRIIKFEKVQHITFVTVRQPSFMGLLGIPFVLGPLGGGERIPYFLRNRLGIKGWLRELFRDIANLMVKFDPLMHITFCMADKIYVTSLDSESVIPKCYHVKVKVLLAIGVNERKVKLSLDHLPIKILYVGNIIPLKGLYYGILAYSNLLKLYPQSRLTMVGSGIDLPALKKLATKLGIADMIDWLGWVNQTKLSKIYSEHDVFLFPSLRDSGGMVVLEAMAHGLPVVCADLGGPGVMVNDQCGFVVPATNLENGLGDALIKLSADSFLRKRLSFGAIKRAEEFAWENTVKRVYKYSGKI